MFIIFLGQILVSKSTTKQLVSGQFLTYSLVCMQFHISSQQQGGIDIICDNMLGRHFLVDWD